MNRVLNYPLEVQQREMVQMPAGAQLLGIVVKGGIPFLYALCDESKRAELRLIRCVCAGEEFNAEGMTYIDSFVLNDWFIGHVFEQYEGQPDVSSKRYADDFREIRHQMQPTIRLEALVA